MSDCSSTTDAPKATPSDGGTGRSPERTDVSGDGNGTEWGAGDFCVPPGSGSGWADNDAGTDGRRGHQGGALPGTNEPPPPDFDEREEGESDFEPYDMPGLAGPVPLLTADSDSDSSEGSGDHHQPRWVEDRPVLDPPSAESRARPATDAASQGAAETQKARSHGR
jgi:hypothetical protein